MSIVVMSFLTYTVRPTFDTAWYQVKHLFYLPKQFFQPINPPINTRHVLSPRSNPPKKKQNSIIVLLKFSFHNIIAIATARSTSRAWLLRHNFQCLHNLLIANTNYLFYKPFSLSLIHSRNFTTGIYS